MKILLPARPSDDLKWARERALAETATSIVWEFDFGALSVDSEMEFHAAALAVEVFARELHSAKTERIILYRGSADFKTSSENFDAWRRERPAAREEHLRRLFAADLYANYFQLLSHRLPDEVPIVLAFSEEGCGTRAEREQLLSRERFEHFELERQVVKDANVAVCFPEEALCSQEILNKMDALFAQMQDPFRVIGEPFLTEEWCGIDILYVLPEALSDRGRRCLQGFQAAGGRVVTKEC